MTRIEVLVVGICRPAIVIALWLTKLGVNVRIIDKILFAAAHYIPGGHAFLHEYFVGCRALTSPSATFPSEIVSPVDDAFRKRLICGSPVMKINHEFHSRPSTPA